MFAGNGNDGRLSFTSIAVVKDPLFCGEVSCQSLAWWDSSIQKEHLIPDDDSVSNNLNIGRAVIFTLWRDLLLINKYSP